MLYVLIRRENYETWGVIGVFSTREKAVDIEMQNRAAWERTRRPGDIVDWEIEEHMLDNYAM